MFEDVGLWKRARYFPQAGEDMHAAVARECRAVRNAVGIFDASTLGKIEVVGPDAAEFLNRMYTNAWTKLEPGRCRYGIMLNEAGFVMDDGVVARLAPGPLPCHHHDRRRAARAAHMEDYLQTEFPRAEVWLTSTTEQWAVIAVQGPKAREVIAPLVEGIDLSHEAMPHMSVREGRICGVPTRLFRVSFTGELGYEINVPADMAARSGRRSVPRASRYGITPYGTETMHVLRAEKGYIIVGQETDGTVTPDDLGLDWAIGKTKTDFVGKRSLTRPDLSAADRKQLVGLLTVDHTTCWRRARRSSPIRQAACRCRCSATSPRPIGASAATLDRSGAGRAAGAAGSARAFVSDAEGRDRGRGGRAGVLRPQGGARQCLRS